MWLMLLSLSGFDVAFRDFLVIASLRYRKDLRRMINPKKTIPQLAGAIVALTGAQACGGDGGGRFSTIEDAVNAFCMKVAGCDLGYTMQECVAYYDSLIADTNGTAACNAAILSYANCRYGLSCQELANDSEKCYGIWDTLYDRC